VPYDFNDQEEAMKKNTSALPLLRRALVAATLVAALPVLAHAADGIATGDTSKKKIAFSNSFAGNSFRQVMVKSWEGVVAKAKADGIIADGTVVSANGSVTEQAAHIQNMILQGYDAIVLLAASDTALNGVVKQACDAGIVVVAVAGAVTEPCAYIVDYNWSSYGKQEIDFVAEKLGGKGNILEIRGMAGDATDKAISEGIHNAVKAYPDLKIVGDVYGQWTATVAQKEIAGVLPSLPQIDAVVDQGGDGYGAAKAFEATDRKMPIIVMGNRQDELAWWKDRAAKDGYQTFSISATPSVSQVAFWVAQQILAGKEVPKFVEVPLLRIDQKDIDAWLAVTPEGGVSNPFYTQDLVVKMIDANVNKTPLPPIPASQ
jgi:ribose transport system substrate-binding protein